MELTVNRKEFAAAVQSAASIIERKDRQHPGPKICLSAKRGKLTVSLDRHTEKFKETIKPEIKTPGTIFLDADQLKRIMGGLTSESIELIRKGMVLVIRTADSETTIPILTVDKSFEPKFKKLPHRFKIEKKDFKDLYEHCFFAIGNNESRKNLMGLSIKKEGGEIVFMGADAYKISEYRLKKSNNIDSEIILPKTSLKKINSLFGNSENLSFRFDHEYISVSDESRTFQAKLIEATYPNLQNLLKLPKGNRIKFDVKSFMRAARLMKLSLVDDPNYVCKLTLGNQKIRFENQKCSEEATSWIDVPCEYDGEILEIGLNINFLNESIVNIKKKGEIEIMAPGSIAPFYFLDPENPGVKIILMPVKIEW